MTFILLIVIAILIWMLRRGHVPALDLRAIPPLQEFRSRAVSYADLLPYALRIASDIIINKDGSLTASWAYRGADLESAQQATLNGLSDRVNQTIRRFGSGWTFQVDSDRHPAVGYPLDSPFPDNVSWLIDEERRSEFNQARAHYITDYILHVTYRPPTDRARKAWNFFIEDKAGIASNPAEAALRTFKEGLGFIEGMLKDDLALRRLRVRIDRGPSGEVEVDEQLSAYVRSATNRHVVVRSPRDSSTWLGPLVACENLRNGFALRIGNQVLTVIAMDDVPHSTYPGILDILDRMDIAYRVHWRYIVVDKNDAEAQIRKARAIWFRGRRGFLKSMSNDESGLQNVDALQMADDANQAIAEISDNKISFGYFTMSIVVWEQIGNSEQEAHAKARLRENVERVVDELTKLHFVPRVEEENALEAFLGTQVGIMHAQLRRPMLSSRNYADFMPTTAVWTGNPKCPSPMYPHDSPALAYVSTAGTTPFSLNVHVDDVGHFVVVGDTGAGKSTFLGMLLAQHRRYPGSQQIVFDLHRSHYTLCQAVGGRHYDLGLKTMQFAPLAHIKNDPLELQWAQGFIAQLLALQNVNPALYRIEIFTALDDLAKSDVKPSLTALCNQALPREVRDALHVYTHAGSALPILDGEEDTLELASFTCFEMEDILSQGDHISKPAMQYLFHYIERACNGAPTLLLVEEAWKFLENDTARDAMNEWLRTMRKKNVAVGFCSQGLAEFQQSEISAAIIGSCKTKVFLANPGATVEATQEIYRRVGLTPWQIMMLSQAKPKRDYYIAQPEGNRMIDLSIGPVSRCFIGVSSKDDVARVRQLIEDQNAYVAERGVQPEVPWQARWMDERLPREVGSNIAEQWIRHFLLGPKAEERSTIIPERLEKVPA